MPRIGSSVDKWEFLAAKSRILARFIAPNPEVAMAMDLVIVATQVGADIGRLAEKTGFTIDQIFARWRTVYEKRGFGLAERWTHASGCS